MIINGIEVLYTIRNGKIVDPNIPMDGLVCYLDTRGKHNADVYRNTLLDLSGNGNHGTLQNFNFTEESGYVNNLSGGVSGLKFDGVDDQIQLNLTLADYTIIAEAMIPIMESSNYRFLETDGLRLDVNPTNETLVARIINPDGSTSYRQVPHESMGKICIKISGEILEIKTNTNTRIINGNIKNGSTFLRIGKGKVNFRKCLIYNRALTDIEITQLMEV